VSSRGTQVLVLIAAAAAWGLLANTLRSKPLPFAGELGPPPIPESGSDLPAITAPSALRAAEAGAFLVDVRAPEDFLARRVAGALSLPESELQARYFDALAQLSLDMPLVVYGAGADSFRVRGVGAELMQLGHQNVDVMVSGFEALVAAGATLAEGAEEMP
jgi:rhodanese-related sulfurtransferase